MKVILLAAGFGSRLWPLSTSEQPKQFQFLLGEQSLIQYTYQLFLKVAAPDDIYVLTLAGLEHWIYEQLPGIKPENVLIVPERRNTFPHTLFGLQSVAASQDELVLFSSTDNFIPDPQSFTNSLKSAIEETPLGYTNMVCVKATAADTRLGYARVSGDRIVNFVEKPSETTIQSLLQKGPLYKNSCTYITSANALRRAFPTMDARIAETAEAFLGAKPGDLSDAFLAMPLCDISTTYFAHASDIRAYISPSDFIDLGSFAALHAINDKDEHGNAILGKVLLDGDCTGNFIANHTDQPLVVIDAKNMAIVQTPLGSLTAPIDQASRVGDIYKQKIHTHRPKD